MNIDKRDRGILAALDEDARQSYAEIGRQVGLSKASVMRRVNKLEENNIILGYLTVIDTMRLGYTTYDVYLKWRKTTPEKEQEIIDFLVSHQRVWLAGTGFGSVDFAILISTRSAKEYYDVWEEIYAKIKPYVTIVRTTILVEYLHFTRGYLDPDSSDRRELFVGKLADEPVDDTDWNLLQMLSKDGRAQIIDLGAKLDLSASAVIQRMRKLEERGIIQGYRANLNFHKLGYDYYKVLVRLTDLSIKERLIPWVKQQPNIVYYDGFIGGYDVEFDLEIESTDALIVFLNSLKSEFGTYIEELEHFRALIIHKSTYFPEQ